MTSFIYQDQKLLHQLIRQGQIAADPKAYAQQLAQLKQMVSNLEASINSSNTSGVEVSHEDLENGQDVPLRPTDLNSLETLISFTAINKITANGQRVAYPQSEAASVEGNDHYQEQAFGNQTFYVDPQVLSAYLTSLQASMQHAGPVIATKLNFLIGQANKLMGTQVNPQYQPPKTNQADSQQQTGNQQQTNNQPRPANNQNAAQLLSEVVQALPFDSETINLEAIKNFANKYAQLAPDNAQVQTIANQINTDITKAYNLMSIQSPIIQMGNLNGDLEVFKRQAKTPAAAYQLAGALYSVIDEAGKLFQMFVYQSNSSIQAVYKDNAPQAMEALKQQVMNDGPQIQNRNALSELMLHLKQDLDKGFKH